MYRWNSPYMRWNKGRYSHMNSGVSPWYSSPVPATLCHFPIQCMYYFLLCFLLYIRLDLSKFDISLYWLLCHFTIQCMYLSLCILLYIRLSQCYTSMYCCIVLFYSAMSVYVCAIYVGGWIVVNYISICIVLLCYFM